MSFNYFGGYKADVEFARETGENSVTGPPQVHDYAISVV